MRVVARPSELGNRPLLTVRRSFGQERDGPSDHLHNRALDAFA
jgi:hypothetical protein